MVVLTTACPGMLHLALFDQEQFARLEFLKLLMLSLAITSPFLIVNMAISGHALTKGAEPDASELFLLQVIMLGAGWAVYPLYIPVLLHIAHPISARWAAATAVLTQIVVSVFALRYRTKSQMRAT
jgi:hypothetical protein